jgi:predicted amidophosphoribosyltransferase
MFRFFTKLFRPVDPLSSIGTCESCHQPFEYALVHNGFADTAYAYCDRCGTTALLSSWYEKIPPGAPLRVQGLIEPETESWLQPCSCNGAFRRDASPRCPHCGAPLSAELATRYIEKSAPGTKRGWRWQRNWLGMYAIVIARRIVNNNWRDSPVRK